MICDKCQKGKHRKCKAPATCTCQHKKLTGGHRYVVRTHDEISRQVGENIRLRRPGAIDLNADMPPTDC